MQSKFRKAPKEVSKNLITRIISLLKMFNFNILDKGTDFLKCTLFAFKFLTQ